MTAFTPQLHVEAAQSLYLQRLQLLAQPLTEAQFVAHLEHQLTLHLHSLAHHRTRLPEPGCRASAFVTLAVGLLPPHCDKRAEAIGPVVESLHQAGEMQGAAFDALCLFGAGNYTTELLELYHHNSELRPLLFNLWRQQQVTIPAALTSVAELRSQDPQLQVAALDYAASRPESGKELFLPYFQGLTSGGRNYAVPGTLLATALWGAMLHGATGLDKPLWRAIETEKESEPLYRLFRLAALRADPNLVGVIAPFTQKDPGRGAELLALHGTKEAIRALVELSPRAAAHPEITAAWLMVSGRDLAPTPHLRLVGAEEQDSQVGDTVRTWWQQTETTMQPDDRFLMGEVLTRNHLLAQCRHWAGAYHNDLLDLLALQRRAPLGFVTRGLQYRQNQALDQLGGAA